MKKEIKAQFSCKRKPDFVSFSAIGMFVLLILFQLYLTLVVPVQLKEKDALERFVMKEEISTRIDGIRMHIRQIKHYNLPVNPIEIALVENVTDSFAGYLREAKDTMTLQQIFQMEQILAKYQTIVLRWIQQPPRNHLVVEQVDTKQCLSSLELRLMNSFGPKDGTVGPDTP